VIDDVGGNYALPVADTRQGGAKRGRKRHLRIRTVPGKSASQKCLVLSERRELTQEPGPAGVVLSGDIAASCFRQQMPAQDVKLRVDSFKKAKLGCSIELARYETLRNARRPCVSIITPWVRVQVDGPALVDESFRRQLKSSSKHETQGYRLLRKGVRTAEDDRNGLIPAYAP
jgi:hypothetical protein